MADPTTCHGPEAFTDTPHKLPNNPTLDALVTLLGGQLSPILRSLTLLNSLFGARLGIDPALLFTFVAGAWVSGHMLKQLYAGISTLVVSSFTCSVRISSSDELFTHMMEWLAVQPCGARCRSLTAKTLARPVWEKEEEIEAVQCRSAGRSAEKYFNFSKQNAKASYSFSPAASLVFFWHGRYFHIELQQQPVDPNGSVEREILLISCFGRRTEPIKELLGLATKHHNDGHKTRTIIRRPRQFTSTTRDWYTVASRPARDLSTVVLREDQKSTVLKDMNEYLSPTAPRWYADRGIPLRRGYLFHGPPGTGKTSLIFALAGTFGLGIYVISLMDPNLTEEELSKLFSDLPRRSIVLLEDVDAAGLKRTAKEAEDQELKGSGTSGGDDKKGVSLSGLLNVIDGVAAQEGRILIMTTNRPESLDDALIRPGRIDVQVAFANATSAQAEKLFKQIYVEDSPVSDAKLGQNEKREGSTSEAVDGVSGKTMESGSEDLQSLAKEFGRKIPDGLLSPAGIQGFLLTRKGDPKRAVDDTDSWVESTKA